MTRYMIERRYGASHRDWLTQISEASCWWSGLPNALAFSSKRRATRTLAAVRRLARRWPAGDHFVFAVVDDEANDISPIEAAPRHRAGSWSYFERRFRPVEGPDGSLMWEWADLPQPVDLRRVWTVTDCDGRLYVSAGLHYVNRVGYVVTEVASTPADERRDWRYA